MIKRPTLHHFIMQLLLLLLWSPVLFIYFYSSSQPLFYYSFHTDIRNPLSLSPTLSLLSAFHAALVPAGSLASGHSPSLSIFASPLSSPPFLLLLGNLNELVKESPKTWCFYQYGGNTLTNRRLNFAQGNGIVFRWFIARRDVHFFFKGILHFRGDIEWINDVKNRMFSTSKMC